MSAELERLAANSPCCRGGCTNVVEPEAGDDRLSRHSSFFHNGCTGCTVDSAATSKMNLT